MANILKIKRGAAASIPQGQLGEPLFTTDTYDLYIGKGSGGNQRIQKYITSGTSSQFLKGDGSLDSNTYEPSITAGTTLQYWRGDKSWQTLDTSVVPENGPIYFTEPRVLATVLTGLNLSGGGTIAATDSILTAFGKVQNQISAMVGGVIYQGTWNASTNSPTLTSSTGTKGWYYIVTVAGSTNLDGITDWKVGDWAIFNGTTWDKVDNTDAVSSVNGFTGAVNLSLGDISNVTLTSPTNNQLIKFDGTTSKWVNFTPAYEPTLTKGNLTEATSTVLTITGGTGAVIGSGTTIEVKSASATQNGVITTGTQTIAGIKTFSNATNFADINVNNIFPNNNNTDTIGSSTGNNYKEIYSYKFIKVGGTSSQFLKADGSVDSTSYLPLAGGTLTGALNGTSAVFNASVTATNFILSGGTGNTGLYYTDSSSHPKAVVLANYLATGTLQFETGGGVIQGTWWDTGNFNIGTNVTTDPGYKLNVQGTGNFTGALSGTSATFSSTITSGSDYLINSTTATKRGYTYQSPASNWGPQVSGIYFTPADAVNAATTFTLNLWNGTSAIITPLTIAPSGAATFSSSVTSQSLFQITPVTNTDNALYRATNAGGTAYIGLDSNGGGLISQYALNVYHSGAYPIVLSTHSTERMRITSGGNVGIGTTSPNSFDNYANQLVVGNGSTHQGITIYASTSTESSLYFADGTGASSYRGYIFYNHVSDLMAIGTNGSRAMTITSGGAVGIGTNDPSSYGIYRQLVVYGGSTGGGITIASSGTATGVLAWGNGTTSTSPYKGYIEYQHSADDMVFATNASERMRITSGGYLKASNNGTYFSSTSAYHEFCNNTTNTPALFLSQTNTSFTDNVLFVEGYTNTTNNTWYLISAYNRTAAAYKFRVADSGNVTNTNNSYGQISDIKLKENISDASPKLADILKVRIKNFNFIGDNQKQIGVIAQELEEIFPSMIEIHNDKDENGNDLGTITKSVKYSVFVPMLVKAIQEQQAQIEQLKLKLS